MEKTPISDIEHFAILDEAARTLALKLIANDLKKHPEPDATKCLALLYCSAFYATDGGYLTREIFTETAQSVWDRVSFTTELDRAARGKEVK